MMMVAMMAEFGHCSLANITASCCNKCGGSAAALRRLSGGSMAAQGRQGLGKGRANDRAKKRNYGDGNPRRRLQSVADSATGFEAGARGHDDYEGNSVCQTWTCLQC